MGASVTSEWYYYRDKLRCVAGGQSTLLERSCCHASVWIVHLCCAEGKWRCFFFFYVDKANQEGEDKAWCHYM